MIPPIVKDFIDKTTDNNKHYETRQHYYQTLLNIRSEIDKAIHQYEIERNFNKKKEKQ